MSYLSRRRRRAPASSSSSWVRICSCPWRSSGGTFACAVGAPLAPFRSIWPAPRGSGCATRWYREKRWIGHEVNPIFDTNNNHNVRHTHKTRIMHKYNDKKTVSKCKHYSSLWKFSNAFLSLHTPFYLRCELEMPDSGGFLYFLKKQREPYRNIFTTKANQESDTKHQIHFVSRIFKFHT